MDGPLAHAIAEEIHESPAKKIVKSNDDKKKLDILDRKIQAAQNDRSPLATLVEEPAEHTGISQNWPQEEYTLSNFGIQAC